MYINYRGKYTTVIEGPEKALTQALNTLSECANIFGLN